jgi:hypothetical protein
MENKEQIQVMEVQSSEIAYGQDKAAIDSQVATAKMYPRNIKRSVDNAIALVTMDTETASTCTYSVPRAGKAISGPSVHLAKIIAQVWGNMRIEAKVIGVDAKNVTSQAIAFDLESNVAIKVEVKRSILTKYGRMNEDMIVVTGNAANSIALRNAIFAVIPKAVTDKVYKEAQKTITGDVSDATKLLKKKKQVFDGLKNAYEVTEQEILSSVGKVSIDHITQEDLIVLIGIGTSIKDGDTTIDSAFRKKKDEPKVELSAEQKAALEYDNNISMLIATATDVEQLDAIKEDNMPEKFNEEWQAAYAELMMPTKSKK